MKVVKRDGQIVDFQPEKIKKAIDSCFRSCCLPSAVPSSNDIDKVYDDVIQCVGKRESITVENIQDCVERALMRNGYLDEAKSYILYRERHKNLRELAEKDVEFIKNFVESSNAANSTIDDNSNVGTKGVGVMNSEIHKYINANTNMYLWEAEVKKLYPEIPTKQMRTDFKTIVYPHDFSSQILMPYCEAVSMYPFLLRGIQDLGGKSATPKSLESFCGIFVNMVFALAGEVKGAVACPEALMYMDYFTRKEYGEDYIYNLTSKIGKRTIREQIHQYFQQITYSINQISGARSMQSPFTNFSFFDENFFNGMFGEFYFPDGTRPVWETTNWLQQEYLHWLNQERLKCILTFPVCSYACLTENNEFKDKDTFEFICKEYSEGNSFFLYTSNSVDSLSSCCRLSNAIEENTFNFTNGQIGVMTGSKNVITLDLNRIMQDFQRSQGVITFPCERPIDEWIEDFKIYLTHILERVYKYQTAYNHLLHWGKDNHLYAAYDAGFIDLDKQYLTIGINGLNQMAEVVGIKCNNNSEYKKLCREVFGLIKEQNTLHRTKLERFNCEQVPAESASIKLYNRDKNDGYWVPSDTNLYASYIFKPNDPEISVLDKIILHSSEFAADQMDGGQACHINLDSHLSKEQYKLLLNFAAQKGCKYLTFNIPNCECDDCGFIAKQPFTVCPKCGSTHISLWDRIIGYLTKIKNWSEGRQIEQQTRIYSKEVC